MNIKYCVVSEKYMLGSNEYNSYGIAAVEVYNESHNVIASVHNCSCCFDEMRMLAELCNKLKLSPEHLGDVTEDILS